MKFISTKNNLLSNLEGAIFNPIPVKESLWLPKDIEKLPIDFFNNIHNMTFNEICVTVATKLIGDEIPTENLKNIINECYDFDIPLIKISDNLHILELFHGPTMTFKDIGARFMSKIIQYFSNNKKIDIIVSTSGDTGSAVADAFYNIPNIKVHILYPKNKISKIQEYQITNYGNNIIPYEVDGNFDNCQKLIKDTLSDKEMSNLMELFPANSINIARLIPQSFYYFWLYAQLKKKDENLNNIVISIPSGNLGNLTGGIIAKKLGLPINMFIAGTNDNKAFPEYLHNNEIKTNKVFHTISNAMDIGIPNNLIRLKSFFGNNLNMQKLIDSYSITESDTIHTIEKVYNLYKYCLDPHTAVGYKSIENFIEKKKIKDFTGIILSTAHPAKFPEVMDNLKVKYDIPTSIQNLKLNNNKHNLPFDYKIWKSMLIKSNNFKNITFIGMAGTGKSHISKLLSIKTKWELREIDDIIERSYGEKLNKLILKYGNDQFIKIEEDMVLRQNGNYNIFSPGGSIIYSEKAMEYLRNISLVIYLNTSINTILNRIGDYKKRGIVLKKGETIEQLYEDRHLLYSKYKHLEINCNLYNDKEIVNLVNSFI